jgi:hypothetical protein
MQTNPRVSQPSPPRTLDMDIDAVFNFFIQGLEWNIKALEVGRNEYRTQQQEQKQEDEEYERPTLVEIGTTAEKILRVHMRCMCHPCTLYEDPPKILQKTYAQVVCDYENQPITCRHFGGTSQTRARIRQMGVGLAGAVGVAGLVYTKHLASRRRREIQVQNIRASENKRFLEMPLRSGGSGIL